MGPRNVSRQADALARARERRRALDRGRDEHDQRVEEATASALVALEARAAAEAAWDAAGSRVGNTLRLLIAEDVSVDRAAALVEIDAAEVRRLVRTATGTSAASSGPGVPET
jgi:hypothetical protein